MNSLWTKFRCWLQWHPAIYVVLHQVPRDSKIKATVFSLYCAACGTQWSEWIYDK